MESAISEVVSVLTAEGIHIDDWKVLAKSNRLVVELRPCGWIAKICRTGALDQMDRELAVAAHVVACGGPAASPAPARKVRRARGVVFSLWEALTWSVEPPAEVVCSSYRALRSSLDSFQGELPDFSEAIVRASRVAQESALSCLTSEEATFLRSAFASSVSSLSELRWSTHTLHGDPHTGNVVLTTSGPRWLDFESVCAGPLEWDLSALPGGAHLFVHDSDLLRVLVSLRRACVVTWCAARARPHPPELEAIRHHLGELKADAALR